MLSGCTARSYGNEVDLEDPTEAERDRLQERARFAAEQWGYGEIRETRPQTLAYALTDSPAGQLAWIVEKFKEWTDSSERPEDAVDRDQMLTNVTLYWLTRTAGSSARRYYETNHASGGVGREPSRTPVGVAVFPREIFRPIRRLAERRQPIVHWVRVRPRRSFRGHGGAGPPR